MDAQRDDARSALAVPPEVELEDVVALLEPRDEGGQLQQAMAVKPCSTMTAVRVSRAAGTSQPLSVTPSSVVMRTGS